MDDSAFVSNIQRFCVHDGPGIRTVVFLTGCPLRCKWCQNPETYTAAPQLMYNKALCTRCGLCVEACPRRAISMTDNDGVCTDRGLCDRCFLCTQACSFLARQVSSSPVASSASPCDAASTAPTYSVCARAMSEAWMAGSASAARTISRPSPRRPRRIQKPCSATGSLAAEVIRLGVGSCGDSRFSTHHFAGGQND